MWSLQPYFFDQAKLGRPGLVFNIEQVMRDVATIARLSFEGDLVLGVSSPLGIKSRKADGATARHGTRRLSRI